MTISWVEPSELRNGTHPDAEYAIEVASWILYKLTAEKYPGIREYTEWYGRDPENCWCTEVELAAVHTHLVTPAIEPNRVALRHSPARSITSVRIDGVAVDPSRWRLLNGRWLVRTDSCSWNLFRGVEVTYRAGQNPPKAGQHAAARLADEIVQSFIDPGSCALPDRVTAISRQGVSYTILDPQEFIRDGRTGIYEIDLFINAANPGRARQKPRVYSPDAPRRRAI
jgi:hypothetical protein